MYEHPTPAVANVAWTIIDMALRPATIDSDRYARRLREAARKVIDNAHPTNHTDMVWSSIGYAIIGGIRRNYEIVENQAHVQEILTALEPIAAIDLIAPEGLED